MKVCNTCHAQFDDSQNFCPTCGCALVEYTPVAPAAPVAPEVVDEPAKAPFVVTLLGFIGKVLSIFAAMFMGCAIASPYIRSSLSYSSYTNKYSVYTYLSPDEACAVLGLLLALGALGLAVFELIMTLIKKPTVDKLFAALVKPIAMTALFIVSIVIVSNI